MLQKPTKEVNVMTNDLVDKFQEECKLKTKAAVYTTEDFERGMQLSTVFMLHFMHMLYK